MTEGPTASLKSSPPHKRRWIWIAALSLFLLEAGPAKLNAAQLESKTLVAFNRYVQQIEAQMKRDRDEPGKFLYIDSLPVSEKSQIQAQIQRGDVYLAEIHPKNAAGHTLHIPDGWAHHWFAVMYIPGATIEETLGVLEDYNRYQQLYKPEIVRSRILERNGNHFLVYARLQKKTPWLTVTLDMDSDVNYFVSDSKRAYMISHSTRIMQVDNAGRPDEHVDPPGQGSGYLWAMDSYWRLEQKRGGVIAEWESVALSRNPPFALGWIIRPFIRGAVRSTVQSMMLRTRAAIQALHPQNSKRARLHGRRSAGEFGELDLAPRLALPLGCPSGAWGLSSARNFRTANS